MSYEPLGAHEGLRIRQKPRGMCWELCCGLEFENEYRISPLGHHTDTLWLAREHTTCCCLCFCGVLRRFQMTVADESNTLLRFFRPFRCRCTCFPKGCCQQILNVHDADMHFLGSVFETAWCWPCSGPRLGI